MACFPHAEAQLRELMELSLSKEQRLEALCFLADIQVIGGGALQRGCPPALRSISLDGCLVCTGLCAK